MSNAKPQILREAPDTKLGQKLSAQQRKACLILAYKDKYQRSYGDIAEEVGVSERTVFRWRNNRDFIAYQNELAEQMMEEFITEAYLELKGLLRSENEKSKLKAIELFLKNRGKLTDVQKVEATITDDRSNDALEAELEELKRQLGE